jgi:hypothetical protein
MKLQNTKLVLGAFGIVAVLTSSAVAQNQTRRVDRVSGWEVQGTIPSYDENGNVVGIIPGYGRRNGAFQLVAPDPFGAQSQR